MSFLCRSDVELIPFDEVQKQVFPYISMDCAAPVSGWATRGHLKTHFWRLSDLFWLDTWVLSEF